MTVRDDYLRDGAAIIERFLPDDLIDRYCAARAPIGPGGWSHPTPYMDVAELRDLCCWKPLVRLLANLVGEPVGVHLNLTGWVSTERAWHQDGYLNPDEVGDAYVAVWMALDDIHPSSGPFEWIPGSHRWPERLTREDVWARAGELRDDPGWATHWPKLTERFVVPYWQDVLARRGVQPRRFLARRGDVLVWHPWTLHRGSEPNVPGLERRALIAHYSGLEHRPDMPQRARWGGGWYFVLPTDGEVA